MIVIDSNIWIFSENANSQEHEIAAKRVKEVFDSNTFGINVVITSETYHILSKFLGIADASSRIIDILEHPLGQWLDFTNETALNAVKLSRKHKIRINDALIAQQALEANARLLTDNIKDFEKIKGLKIIPLR